MCGPYSVKYDCALGWFWKKWNLDFLTGHPLIWCIIVKKYPMQNFITFDWNLEVATGLWSFVCKVNRNFGVKNVPLIFASKNSPGHQLTLICVRYTTSLCKSIDIQKNEVQDCLQNWKNLKPLQRECSHSTTQLVFHSLVWIIH